MNRREVGARSSCAADFASAVVIGVAGLVLRLVWVVQFTSHPLGRIAWVDEGAYGTRALAILNGHWLPEHPFYQDPLFAYLLAGLMRVAGPDVGRLRIALACLGSLTPVAVFWVGRLGLGRAEAIVAGLATAVFGPLVFTDGLLEKEGVAALAAALALGLCALAAERTRSVWVPFGAGLAWGVVALLRANALLIAPVGAAWLFWGVEGRRGWRVIGFVFGFSLALAPAVAVNVAVSRPRELLLTTWQAGPNFYVGNGPEATGTYAAPEFVEAKPAREADDFAAEARRRTGRALTVGQVSRFWFAAGLERWRSDPAASLGLLVVKLGLLAHDFEIPDNQNVEVVRLVAAPALAWGVLSFGWLTPWAALGLARSRRTPFWWFLVLSTATGLLSTAVFFVVGRYRIPWVPGLALLAAAGAVDVARRFFNRQWRSLCLRVALLVVPATLLAWRPLRDPVPDRWGHAEIELALAYLSAGQLEPAIDACDDARALGPGPSGRVAELLAAGPGHDLMARAVALGLAMERRLGRSPDLRRARWLRQLPEGRSESRRRLDEALRNRPDDPVAHRELGAWWLGAVNDPEARRNAAVELHQAAQDPSGDPSAAIALALLSRDRAPLSFPAAGRLDPRSPRLRLAQAILAAASRDFETAP